MNQRQSVTDAQLNEDLIAYLDGELDAEAVASIDKRLAEDEKFRQRLQSAQRAWDLLDYLPRGEASESFTKTTVELVAVSAARDVEKNKSSAAAQRRFGWLAGIACTIAAGVVGYAVSSHLLSAENRQLIEDLPVIENVDVYRHAESIDFLIRLDQEDLFTEEADDAI